ncbi:putative MFS family arabinose efflux permease [Pseudonocardia sediminis]|uniref:Putative MFS family arabinose efflux permease n=1 Tax=Pseudonocardia sediminis TaxID=1397368 RepID=A0A4Q7USH7_PSEST|nr:putative MFS family arabinose efflux permease [Pseudonocardia sediminis]
MTGVEQGRAWMRPAVALFGVAYGANQFSPLMVMYREQGHYSATVVAAFFAVYVAGLAPGLLIGGPASDRWGRRAVLLPAAVVSIPASAVIALGAFSEALLYAGRLLFGVCIGVAMAVATTWVKELSGPPHDPSADDGAGARRAAIALTGGFGVGPLVGGLLAQFAPLPMELPYVVHILLMVPAVWLLVRAPETRPSGMRSTRSLLADLKVPAAAHPRFVWLVLPAAPWVFGAASLSFAVQPTTLGGAVGSYGLLVATLITAVTLTSGFLAQYLARRVDARSRLAGTRIGMTLVIAGTLVAAVTAATQSIPVAFAGAVLFGAGYGFTLLSGLQEVQRIAAPEHLAGLTAVFYTLTYVGFLLPLVLSALTPVASYPVLLGAVAVLEVVCLALVVAGARRRSVTATSSRAPAGSRA